MPPRGLTVFGARLGLLNGARISQGCHHGHRVNPEATQRETATVLASPLPPAWTPSPVAGRRAAIIQLWATRCLGTVYHSSPIGVLGKRCRLHTRPVTTP